jgi:hypothetical protein
MRHVKGQEDTAGLEAAVALTDDPKFLERVKMTAGKLRLLIRQGGKHNFHGILVETARLSR